MRYLLLAALMIVGAVIVAPKQAHALTPAGWYLLGPPDGVGAAKGDDANNCFQSGGTANHNAPHCLTLTHVCQLLAQRNIDFPPPAGGGDYYIFVEGAQISGSPPNTGHYVENAVCNASGYSPSQYLIIIGNGAAHFAGVPGVQKPVIEMTGSNIHWGKFDVENNSSTNQDAVYIHGTASQHSVGVQYFYNTTIGAGTDYFNGTATSVPGINGLGVHVQYEDGFILKQDTVTNVGAGLGTAVGGVLIEDSGDGTLGSGPVIYGNAINRIGSLTGIPANPGYGVRFVNSPYGCYQENHTKNEFNSSGQRPVLPNIDLVNSPNAYLLGNFAPFAYTADAASQQGLVVSSTVDQGPCAAQFQ